MLVSEGNFPIELEKRPYIVLGNFDGVHLGHRELINKACMLSKEDGISMVYTFKEHPLNLINKAYYPKLLMDNKRKLEIFESLGVDVVKFIEFNYNIMRMSPIDFIDKLVREYNPKSIIVGFNYKFGYENSGDVSLLKTMEKKYNYKLNVIKEVKIGDNIVSSSLIRSFIQEGRIEEANIYLHSIFSIYGKVVHGKEIGGKINFPTANIKHENYILPKVGVYYTNVSYNSNIYKCITNIGYNPTISGGNEVTIETHIINFEENIYDKSLRIFFVKRIRDEVKFNSLEKLRDQLRLDKEFAIKEDIIEM